MRPHRPPVTERISQPKKGPNTPSPMNAPFYFPLSTLLLSGWRSQPPQGHYDTWPRRSAATLIVETNLLSTFHPPLSAWLRHAAGARQNGASCFRVQSKLHFVLHWQYRPNLGLPRRKSRILSQSVTAPIALTPLASRAVLCFRPTRVLEIRMNHRLIRHTGHHPNGKNQNPRCPTTEGASLRL